MKGKYLTLAILIAIIYVGICYAEGGNYWLTNDIKTQSLALTGSNETETIQNIIGWVQGNITYEYYYSPRGITTTWIERMGDCTDMSDLIAEMLHAYNISVRKVTGYGYYFVDYDIRAYRHDWLEYDGQIIDAIPALDYRRMDGTFI